MTGKSYLCDVLAFSKIQVWQIELFMSLADIDTRVSLLELSVVSCTTCIYLSGLYNHWIWGTAKVFCFNPLIPPSLQHPHPFPALPLWVISISPLTLIFQSSPKNQLKVTFHLQNSFQRHPLAHGALQREKPFIFDSCLSWNGSNVSCNPNECNQAGFWWVNGWTRAPLASQEWDYIWQLCHIFSKKLSLISRQRSSWSSIAI